MNKSYTTKLILGGSSLVKILLVAGLVFSLGWGLVQIAQWKNRKPVSTVEAEANGEFILLADTAEIIGEGSARANLHAGKRNIGWWYETTQSLSWQLNVEQSGPYRVVLEYALPKGRQTDFQIEASEKSLFAIAPATGGWNAWEEIEVGMIELKAGKEQTLILKPIRIKEKTVMNFVSLRLKPE